MDKRQGPEREALRRGDRRPRPDRQLPGPQLPRRPGPSARLDRTLQVPQAPAPVSYTHLDVYKRQPSLASAGALGCSGMVFLAGTLLPLQSAAAGAGIVAADLDSLLHGLLLGSVSYTHLDVYKRQPHDSIPGEKGGENRYVNLLEALI